MQLLGHAGLRRIFANHSAIVVPDDDGGESYGSGIRRRRRTKRSKHPFPPVPSEEGTKLMRSGTFGSTDYYRDLLKKRNRRLATRIMNRELGTERSHPAYQDKIMAQVCSSTGRITHVVAAKLTCWVGSYTIFNGRLYNSLQCSLLFWTIFR